MYHMSSEHHILFKTNNVIVPSRVGCFYFIQNLSFYHSLISIFTLIFDDLKCYLLFILVIVGFKYLSKGSLADDGYYLIPEAYMVLSIYFQVAMLIIKVIYETNEPRSLFVNIEYFGIIF
jgi:predicted tellurium resistance membrane protein TerC